MKIIALETWSRKEHFEFFSKFDEPYFGLVAEVDCTIAYNYAKEKGISFFAYYLHKALVTANLVEAFRYRIVDDKIGLFDEVHASTTIGRKDGSFGFSFVTFDKAFEGFNSSLNSEIQAVQDSIGLRLNENGYRKDTIQFSSIPWVNFTGLTHARNYNDDDSVPKVSFGKMTLKGEKRIMSVGVYANHAFVDGFHIGQYFEEFQKQLNS